MTIGNLNVCHLRNKIDDVNVLIKNHPDKVHIFGINEARLDNNIDDSLIHINNYSFFRKDAKQKMATLVWWYTFTIQSVILLDAEKTLRAIELKLCGWRCTKKGLLLSSYVHFIETLHLHRNGWTTSCQ